jgi:hypothetical protein
MSINNYRFSPAYKHNDWASLKDDLTVLIKAQNPTIDQSFYASLASEFEPDNYPYYTNKFKCKITRNHLVDVSINNRSNGLHHGYITFCLPEFLQRAKKMQFLHNDRSKVICYKICSANSSASLSIFNADNKTQNKVFHLQGDPDDRIYVDTREDPCNYSQHIMIGNKHLSIYENSKNKYLGVNVLSVIDQRNVISEKIEILQIKFCYSDYNDHAITEKIIDLLSLITGDNMWFVSKI